MPVQSELNTLLDRFAALGDIIRLRILSLLQMEELSVGELAKVLQVPQSTVSRHLKVLYEGAWVSRRSVGTAAYYHFDPDHVDETAQSLWEMVSPELSNTPQEKRDRARLTQVIAQRETDTHSFFGRVGGDWDKLRNELFGSLFTLQALPALLPPEWTIADIGCGTGNAAEILAPHVKKVIAVDISPAMLKAAHQRLQKYKNVSFVESDLLHTPLETESVDAAICILVLHHIDNPVDVLKEMMRFLKPGGPVLILDMISHEHESYRRTMGHRHLGFTLKQIASFTKSAGFQQFTWHPIPPDPDASGPQLFVATAR